MQLSSKAIATARLAISFLFIAPGVALGQDVEAQHEESVATEAPQEDVTNWTISAGGVLNTGNTETLQVNAGTAFRLVRGHHGFNAEANYILGLAGTNFAEETANNFRGRLRYDYFLTRMDALFISAAVRQDRFAGLAPRLQGQAGYARHFLRDTEDKHRFWGEIGYDLTHDRFDYDILDRDVMMPPTGRPTELTAHSARAFLGYDNQLNEALTFTTGAEFLVNLDPNVILTEPDGTERTGLEDLRVNWINAVRFQIVGALQGEINFTLNFDNVPAIGAAKLDTITMLNLIYTLPVSGDEEEE